MEDAEEVPEQFPVEENFEPDIPEGGEEEEFDENEEYEYDEDREDFPFPKRMRGAFRCDDQFRGGYPPRGRGYGPGGPPPRFRGPPPPNWARGRGPRFGGWREEWDGRGPNWGQMGPPPGYNGPPGMIGPPGMPPPMMGPHGPMNMCPPGGFGPMGGPPNMGLDMSGEIWVETKSPEGKPYFYHARTRETTWTKPEGPTVKVYTQEQVEQMANSMAPVNMGPMGPMGPGPMGPMGAMGAPEGYPPPAKPAVNENKEETPNGTPTAEDEGSQSPGAAAAAVPGAQPGPMMGGYGAYGMPPPGFQGGGYPGYPGMWGMPASQPHLSAPASKPDDLTQIDPQIVARAAEWSEHKAPDGRPYFYNAKAGESVWEKPQALKDLETAKLAAAQGISMLPPAMTPSTTTTPGTAMKPPAVPNTVDKADSSSDDEPTVINEGDEEDSSVRSRAEEEVQLRMQKEEEERAAEMRKLQDRARPVSSTPVPGTPWCVVWTGDGRVFFYNPSTRTSVWEKPEELAIRPDVEKLVTAPPDAVVNGQVAAVVQKREEEPGLLMTVMNRTDDNLEPSPAKKMKMDTKVETNEAKMRTQIDIGKEAAIEAEVRAARERAIVPLDKRVKSFKEMLAEKEVSAFSTWEKELHKIVFDTRYLLLTSKERKQVFEKYVKERAEEERREKRNKMKEKKEDFRRLMESANLHGKSSFSDFASKWGKDDRFRNIDKMRERESLFNEFILEVRKREKEEKIVRREQIKKDYFQMLRESADVDRHSRYNDVKKKLSSDPRYKAVDSSTAREDWFREHVKQLKDERKKDKEKDKKDRKREERKERDKDKDKDKDRDKDKHREKKDKEAKEEKEGKEESKGEEESKVEDEDMPLHDPERSDTDIELAGNSEEEREKEKKEKEKQARVEASLREREKEVQRTLATHLRDRDKEREHHKRDEAVQHLNALMADLVRSTDLSWKEARRLLRKDHRWELADLLERDEKEKLFNTHVEQLTHRKREKFRELLDETGEVTLTSSWKEIKKLIKEDPRYSKFSSSERKIEREFKDYIKDKYVTAKADFRELLQETKLITHNSLKLLQENEQHIHEIEEILKKDKRYLVLNSNPDERTKLILSYLEDLEKRGPPPPPTASEPNRRNK